MSARGRTPGHELRVEPLTREAVDGVPVAGIVPARRRLDLAVVAYFEDERPLRGLAAFLDWRADGKLSRLLRSGWCTGRAGEAVLLPGARGLPSERIVLLGLGSSRGFGIEQARVAATAAVELVRKLLPRDVLFAMPGLAEDREIVESVFAGIVLALGGTPGDPEPEPEPEPESESGSDSGSDPDPDADADADPNPGSDSDSEPDPDPDEVRAARARATAVTDVGSARTSGPATKPVLWWILADPRHVGRLRRVLDGPPRAAVRT